eukprot:33479-Pleurochrysis_carterae.AAC.1
MEPARDVRPRLELEATLVLTKRVAVLAHEEERAALGEVGLKRRRGHRRRRGHGHGHGLSLIHI